MRISGGNWDIGDRDVTVFVGRWRKREDHFAGVTTSESEPKKLDLFTSSSSSERDVVDCVGEGCL